MSSSQQLFNSSIPSILYASFPALKTVDLSYGKLRGSIATAISTSTLTSLILTGNVNLCGSAPSLPTTLSLSTAGTYIGSSCSTTSSSDLVALKALRLAWVATMPVLTGTFLAVDGTFAATTSGAAWNTSLDPCSGPWFGVTCDGGTPPSVTKISLSGLGIVGSIPAMTSTYQYSASLGYSTDVYTGALAFSGLQSLDLSNNKLTFIPADLGGLTSSAATLTSLNLASNSIVGTAPTLLSSFTALQQLSLASVRWMGEGQSNNSP